MSRSERKTLWLGNRVFDSYEAIVDAWNWLVAQPGRITSIASRNHAQVTA